MISIPKEDDNEKVNNIRPFSLPPVLSKICEKTVHDQLSSYLQVNGKLSKTQSGNKKKYSTETSLIETTDTIMKAFEKKMITAAVFLDMSRAFDSVNREMIILKLQDNYWRLVSLRSYVIDGYGNENE